jgi:hypothetical protein
MFEYVLIITSFGFILPVLFETTTPFWLQYGLFFTSCISAGFWSDPYLYNNSILHKLDGYLARIMILAIFVYGCINNPIPIFFFMTFLMMVFFILSNRESTKEWCSPIHIFYHIIAHIFAINAIWVII